MPDPYNFRDLTGRRFDAQKLTVISRLGSDTAGHTRWLCLNDNGKEVIRTGAYLTRYVPIPRVLRHPRPKKPKVPPTPEYSVWSSMKARCTNERMAAYKDYGGRGIGVCPQWLKSFNTFLVDMGTRPGPEYSLERKDNDGHYEPGNCLWVARIAQNRNTRSNRRITYLGETLTLSEWAERTGLPDYTIRNRLNMKLPLEEVFRPGRKPHAKSYAKRKPYKKHGLSKTPEYAAWKGMMGRCTKDIHPAWTNYGGRGIRVCARWRVFVDFLADMGERPSPRHSLERLRVDDGYQLDNCCWATRLQQGRNTRRIRRLTLNGQTLCLTEWAEVTGIAYETIRNRLRKGLPVEQVLSAAV